MATKTFTAGSVLTASDTNTYLANSGLVYVTQVTVGSGVSSVTVSNAFSSTYDSYRIILAGVAATNADWFKMTLSGATGASYAYASTYYAYGGAISSDTSGGNSFWRPGVMGSATAFQLDIENPYPAAVTTMHYSSASNGYACFGGGYNSNTTSSTGFTISPNAGTITGGTITVYGYRKA